MISIYGKYLGGVAAFATVLAVSSCSPVKKAASGADKFTYEAEPKVLELKGDSVPYKVKLTAASGDVHQKAGIKIDPVLLYGNEALGRPPVVIKGKKSKMKADASIGKDGGTYEWSDAFKYEPAMVNSKLVAKPTAILKGSDPLLDRCKECNEKVIAEGIITTPLMLKGKEEDILYSIDPYIATEGGVSLSIFYLINSTSFNPNFKIKDGKGTDNKANLKAMSDLLKNPEMQVKGIKVHSFASPDGPLDNNQKLAPGRTKSTYDYLRKELKKMGFQEANDSNFYVRSSLAEDWEGWRKAVSESDLSDKDQILQVMNNNSMTDEQKETEIKKRFPASYNKMRAVMLPSLRRSMVTFQSQAPLKTDEELLASRANLDNLSAAECLQLGKIAPDDNLKITVYQYMTQKYPNDWRGFNNLAVVQARSGKDQEADANFKKASSLNASSNIVKNNQGLMARRTGDFKSAERLLKEVEASGDKDISQESIARNLGALYIRTGEYEKALPYLEKNKCSFNSALGYALAKNNDEAKSSLDCVQTEERDASYYYLAAIVGARSEKLDQVTTNLTRSIQLDAAMRDKAKVDAEFRKYSASSEFQAAIR